MKQITVNGYSEKWLRKGFPWVYPKEITKGSVRPGEWATVRSGGGQVLGVGLLDRGWIALRVLRHGDGQADEAWIHGVLERASRLREAVIGPDTSGYRLVHAENDGLPGVRVDVWSHHIVVILDSPSLAPILPHLVSYLKKRTPRGIHLCYRTDPRDEQHLRPSPAPGLLYGREPVGDVKVLERGLTLGVRPTEGPDVGVYADMRDVRRWLEPSWGGTRVLNTFAYTGAFSVAAALNGALETVSVDLSPHYLERARLNFTYNSLDLDLHEFYAEDTFKALDRFRRKGRTFDRVILDPPSFSHSKQGVWSAKTHMPRLMAAAARVTEAGGWIVACSNQGDLSPRDFRGLVLSGLNKAKRTGQEIWQGGQAADFPALSTFPEGRYLKVTVWRLDG